MRRGVVNWVVNTVTSGCQLVGEDCCEKLPVHFCNLVTDSNIRIRFL